MQLLKLAYLAASLPIVVWFSETRKTRSLQSMILTMKKSSEYAQTTARRDRRPNGLQYSFG
jgi:hypothetical protein